ncbi:MAG: hypothetical protein HRU03_03935 [Nanoarchaeales archaeon]|nr:hypothetical protein [Nanoarchaeales archaeon]
MNTTIKQNRIQTTQVQNLQRYGIVTELNMDDSKYILAERIDLEKFRNNLATVTSNSLLHEFSEYNPNIKSKSYNNLVQRYIKCYGGEDFDELNRIGDYQDYTAHMEETKPIFDQLRNIDIAEYLVQNLTTMGTTLDIKTKTKLKNIEQYLTYAGIVKENELKLVGFDRNNFDPVLYNNINEKMPTSNISKSCRNDDSLRYSMKQWRTADKLSNEKLGIATYLTFKLNGNNNPNSDEIAKVKENVIKLHAITKKGRQITHSVREGSRRTSSKYGELEKQLFGDL